MCGRYVHELTDYVINYHRELQAFVEAMDGGLAMESRFNIAPTQNALVYRVNGDGDEQVSYLRWGLIPSWAKDKKFGNKLINSRSETAHEKPSFRAAFKRRRCLILASGFYEWHTTDAGKQPYLFEFPDKRPFYFYGLWDSWRGPKEEPLDEPLETFTILTTEANAQMATMHHRMPCICDVNEPAMMRWIDPEFEDRDHLRSLLKPLELELSVSEATI